MIGPTIIVSVSGYASYCNGRKYTSSEPIEANIRTIAGDEADLWINGSKYGTISAGNYEVACCVPGEEKDGCNFNVTDCASVDF